MHKRYFGQYLLYILAKLEFDLGYKVRLNSKEGMSSLALGTGAGVDAGVEGYFGGTCFLVHGDVVSSGKSA